MKYTVCTTFNASGYEKYGRRMIQTFLQNWPQEVLLVVYAEKCAISESAPNLIVYDLETSSPELVAFKHKWRDVPKANGNISLDPVYNQRKDAVKAFKWDAVRFSHKVYAIFHCAKTLSTDWLLWMDADTVCHSPIRLQDIQSLCPKNIELCYLGRKGKYTECGLYAMNLSSPAVHIFLQKFQLAYDDAENGIFKLREWHDSFVFDAIRQSLGLNELDWSSHLINGEGHPLINCEWGAWLDHLKGARKDLGRSKKKDLGTSRTEAYWQ